MNDLISKLGKGLGGCRVSVLAMGRSQREIGEEPY